MDARSSSVVIQPGGAESGGLSSGEEEVEETEDERKRMVCCCLGILLVSAGEFRGLCSVEKVGMLRLLSISELLETSSRENILLRRREDPESLAAILVDMMRRCV